MTVLSSSVLFQYLKPLLSHFAPERLHHWKECSPGHGCGGSSCSDAVTLRAGVGGSDQKQQWGSSRFAC